MPRLTYVDGMHVGDTNRTITIELAVRIADAFAHRIPTPKELQQRYGMSRATSFRWCAAFRAARGKN